VGAQERHLVGVGGGDPGRAGLVGGGQTVAGLDLDGGGALPEHLGHQPGDRGVQLVVAGGAGGGDGGADAAGAVGAAGHAGVELLGPVPGEDQMGVGVDEPGEGGPAGGVHPGVGGRGGGGRARPGDPVPVEDEGGVAEQAERALAEAGIVGHQ
jgi:endoglycosylceramidase